MAGFQTSVQLNPAYGIPGDFATTGPWTTVPAMAGELTAGSAGVNIAAFAWADDSTGVVSNGKPNLTSTRFGFVGRTQRAIITTYLAESGFAVAPGFEVTLYDGGAYLYTVPTGGATVGQRVFAKYADGSIVLGTAGSPPTNTGTISTTSGSATITVTTAPSAPIAIGQPISGTGIPAGAVVQSFGTGAGGLGTYVLSANASATGTGVTATLTTAYETRFYVKTSNVAGEVGIISDRGF